MNDIIKVILLNFILFYFLIKKNKSLSIFLIVILFIFLIYLRSKKLLEGQSNIDKKKDEVKFMKMANLDRLLNNMLNIYEDSEKDCIGEYSDFTPCDKKCGITHKYKTYRVKRPAGIFGKKCVEDDGKREKFLCDESDGVYKCIIGESCQEDGDCETNNCDPNTDTCVAKKVCSNTNLDLCNKEECLDLNNYYDYANREFKFNEAESGVKCKLEDKETDDTDTDDEDSNIIIGDKKGSNIDLSKLSAADCKNNPLYWYLKGEQSKGGLTSDKCTMRIPNSVYYEEDSDENLIMRNKIYGMSASVNGLLTKGLYCEIGKTFCPEYDDDDDDSNKPDICKGDENNYNKNLIGVSKKIEKNYIENIYPNNYDKYCKTPISNVMSTICSASGAWPDYVYFENNKNLVNDINNIVPIDDMCLRCENGYKTDDAEGKCRECPTQQNNQFSIDGSGNYKVIYDGEIGNNPGCFRYNHTSDKLTCSNINLDCGGYKMIEKPNTSESSTTYSNYSVNCCKNCEKGKKFVLSEGTDEDPCTHCPPGMEQNPSNLTECIPCVYGKYSNYGEGGTPSASGCVACDPPGITNQARTECSESYCNIKDIFNDNCIGKNAGEITSEHVEKVEGNCVITTDDYTFGDSGVTSLPFSYCGEYFKNEEVPRAEVNQYRLKSDNINSLDFYDECCKVNVESPVAASPPPPPTSTEDAPIAQIFTRKVTFQHLDGRSPDIIHYNW